MEHFAFDKSEIDDLLSIMSGKRENYGLGDVRLFIEKNLIERKYLSLTCGLEGFISTEKFMQEPANLNFSRSNQAINSDLFAKRVMQAVDPLDFTKKWTLSMLKNIFYTLNESKIYSQLDANRNSLGVYFKKKLAVTS